MAIILRLCNPVALVTSNTVLFFYIRRSLCNLVGRVPRDVVYFFVFPSLPTCSAVLPHRTQYLVLCVPTNLSASLPPRWFSFRRCYLIGRVALMVVSFQAVFGGANFVVQYGRWSKALAVEVESAVIEKKISLK